MNLDQLARQAAGAARDAAQAMPVEALEGVGGRRTIRMAVPILGFGLVASLTFLLAYTISAQPPTLDPVTPTETTFAPGPSTTLPEPVTSTTVPDPATSTTAPEQVTTTLPEVLPPVDAQWVRGSVDRIVDEEGEILYEFSPTILFGRNTAWDGNDGFVALVDAEPLYSGGPSDEELVWMRPDSRTTITVPFGDIVDVGRTANGEHVVGIDPIEGDEVRWIDLESGAPADPPVDTPTLDGMTFSAGGREARIEPPDWSDVEFDEIGMPIPPFDLPELVITESGEEVLRLPVGTEFGPEVHINDFDGRRIIITALLGEMAVPPVIAWIIDLECATCTQRIDTESLEFFDLIGVVPSEGPVVRPDLP